MTALGDSQLIFNDINCFILVFNGFTPVTEIQGATATTPTTKNESFDLTPNQIANTRPPDTISEVGGLNGWMLLVGIVAGTVIMVSLVWNSMKLWCRKCERDALTQPPTITYLTQDQALTNTNTGGNRLAEVPVATLNTFQIEIQVKTKHIQPQIAIDGSYHLALGPLVLVRIPKRSASEYLLKYSV